MKKIAKMFRSLLNWILIDNEFQDVYDFHERFGLLRSTEPRHLTVRKMSERVKFLREEVLELQKAVRTQDLAGQADALIDIVYVAKGTAVMLGLPWESLWEEIHGTNMKKQRGIGPRGFLNDVVKPRDWQPPHVNQILVMHGYVREQYEGHQVGIIDEKKCADDVDYKGAQNAS